MLLTLILQYSIMSVRIMKCSVIYLIHFQNALNRMIYGEIIQLSWNCPLHKRRRCNNTFYVTRFRVGGIRYACSVIIL